MCKLKYVVFFMTAIFPLVTFAATEELMLGGKALGEECSLTFFSQIDVRVCLEKKVKDSQQALQQAEAKMADAIAKWDEWDTFINRSKTALSDANQVFANYRKAQCHFLASLSGGGAGNSFEIGRLACVAELNNRRAAQLRDVVPDLPPK